MATRISRRSMLKWSMVGIGGVALAACAPKAPTAAPTQAPAAKATAAPATPAPKAPVELQVINQDNFGYDSWNALSAEFEKAKPGIKIALTLIPFADVEQKVLTSMAGGIALDVVFVHPMYNNSFAIKGAILPLDDYMPQLGVPADDWYPAFKFHEWRGKIWALPHQNNPTIFGYNPNLVKEAGLEEPAELVKQGKWTMQLFDEYCQKLTKGSGVNKQFGTNWLWGGSVRGMKIMYLWGFGADAWNADETKALIATPEAIKSWEHQAAYQWNGWAPAPGELQGVSGVALWNRCVMGSATRWQLQQAASGGQLAPVRMCPWFTFPNGKASVRDATNAFGIYSKTKHAQEAWEYVRWVTIDGHVMLIKQGWVTPLRKSLMDAPYFVDSINPAFESVDVYKIGNENVRVLSHVPRITEIDKMIQAAFDSVVLKQKGAKQAMEEIIPDIEEILAETAKTPLPSVG